MEITLEFKPRITIAYQLISKLTFFWLNTKKLRFHGDVAPVVERLLFMEEVRGSIPCISTFYQITN